MNTEEIMEIKVDEDRLAKIVRLLPGSHDPNDDDMCIMEAVAYVTHKKWTDHPPCVCPVLGAFMRAWNDGLPDDERTDLLKPFIPRLINTRGSRALEQRRATMAADWLIRTHTVAWLRLAKLDKQADLLASLPEITDFAQCPSLMPALTAVRTDAAAAGDAARAAARDAARDAAGDAAGYAAGDAARAAARDAALAAARAAAGDAARAAAWAAARAAAGAAARAAAWDAARAAAWDAARAAARAAAWDAAGAAAGDAAGDAAWDAAWAAARAAAGDAARAAAWDALKKTKTELQASAVQLVERMIALTDDDLKKAA